MNQRTPIIVCCIAALAAACSDAPQPTAPAPLSPTVASDVGFPGSGEKYVAIGTSISMGWASNGVYAGSQLVAWPELLSFGQLHPISLPLIQSPGCQSPYASPLGNGRRLSGEPLPMDGTTCAGNVSGITLPTQNVALAGAYTIDALSTKPGDAAAKPWYNLVLPPGATQVSAAVGQNPTLLSVELGGNDILLTTGGLVIPNVTFTPLDQFEANFDKVLDAVTAPHRKVLVLGMSTNGANLPALRRGDEVWADGAEFAQLGVDVSTDCKESHNYINVSLKSLIEVFTAAVTSTRQVFSCADIPGQIDFVLTPGDIATLNGQLVHMRNHARDQAAKRGYAFVSIGALYDRPDLKPQKYSVISHLTSNAPFGPYISLDGVHPSPLGHAVLALAAANALNDKYHTIAAHAATVAPSFAEQLVEPQLPIVSIEWAKQAMLNRAGARLTACPMPGSCFLTAPKAP
jgi:lysophospholipase L1-like esterase